MAAAAKAARETAGHLIWSLIKDLPPRNIMTPGLGFAFGAMLCFGASDLIYKRGAATGIKAGEFLMAQAWIFCPGVTLYAWLTGTLEVHLSALWGSLAGLFLFVALYNFAQSLHGGAVSTNAPIFRLNFTITAALAILLLGETVTVTKTSALCCALVAVWLLLAEADSERGKSSLSSLTRVLTATVAMAFTNFFYKVGLQHGSLPETMVAAQAWTSTGGTRRLVLCGVRRGGFVRSVCAFATRIVARSGERARARGANELRHHGTVRRRSVPRKARSEKVHRPCNRDRRARIICVELRVLMRSSCSRGRPRSQNWRRHAARHPDR
jgi:uncharacterized membrane protein